jgi:hypothetical protein
MLGSNFEFSHFIIKLMIGLKVFKAYLSVSVDFVVLLSTGSLTPALTSQ